MIIKFNKEELDSNFDELLDAAIKSRLRKEIDRRIEVRLNEIIPSRVSDKYIESKINLAVVDLVRQHGKSLLFEGPTQPGQGGLYFPYNFKAKYDKLIIDKVLKQIKIEDLESAIKHSIKQKIIGELND